MKENKNRSFGKKRDNIYQIIERKFKDNNTYYFIKVEEFSDNDSFQTSYINILDNEYKSFEAAKDHIDFLKEEDKKRTVLEEIVHNIN